MDDSWQEDGIFYFLKEKKNLSTKNSKPGKTNLEI
jgi:hypothetical protein